MLHLDDGGGAALLCCYAALQAALDMLSLQQLLLSTKPGTELSMTLTHSREREEKERHTEREKERERQRGTTALQGKPLALPPIQVLLLLPPVGLVGLLLP